MNPINCIFYDELFLVSPDYKIFRDALMQIQIDKKNLQIPTSIAIILATQK